MIPDGNEVVQLLGAQIGEQATIIAVLRSRVRLAEEQIVALTKPADPEPVA